VKLTDFMFVNGTAHLDRANIGNAKIEGLEASLGMAGTDYNIVVGRSVSTYRSGRDLDANAVVVRSHRCSYHPTKPSTRAGTQLCPYCSSTNTNLA
jgi:hypothetical protein